MNKKNHYFKSELCKTRKQVKHLSFLFQVCDESIPLEIEEEDGEDEPLSSDPDRPHDMGVERTDQVF